MNLLDICLIIILILAFGGAVFIWASNRRKGRGCAGCAGNCGGCRARASCGREDTYRSENSRGRRGAGPRCGPFEEEHG